MKGATLGRSADAVRPAEVTGCVPREASDRGVCDDRHNRWCDVIRIDLQLAALAACGLGVGLHAYTALFKAEGGFSAFLVGLVVWSCLPYAIAALVATRGRRPAIALGAALCALVGDVFMHYSVCVAPKGSTAALGLLFMPLWNLLLLAPAGAAVAWALVRWRRGASRDS